MALATGPNDEEEMVVVSHPPFLPNLTPCDLILPVDEAGFEREAFADVTEVQQESLAALDSITLNILDNVSSSGTTASSHRGSTLKGAKV